MFPGSLHKKKSVFCMLVCVRICNKNKFIIKARNKNDKHHKKYRSLQFEPIAIQ